MVQVEGGWGRGVDGGEDGGVPDDVPVVVAEVGGGGAVDSPDPGGPGEGPNPGGLGQRDGRPLQYQRNTRL